MTHNVKLNFDKSCAIKTCLQTKQKSLMQITRVRLAAAKYAFCADLVFGRCFIVTVNHMYSSLRCPLSIHTQSSISADHTSSPLTSITPKSLTQPSVRSWGSTYVQVFFFLCSLGKLTQNNVFLILQSTKIHFTLLPNGDNIVNSLCALLRLVWPTFEVLSL